MWRNLTGEAVDGVIVVDPLTLRGLLAAEGPIDAGGIALDSESILQYIFLEQYRIAPLEDADQSARRDQLGAIARAAIDAFEDRDWDPPTLVDELAPAGGGRHVLAWSADPVEQRGWEATGIAGELDEDSMLVSLMNIGGNKLDQFMALEGSIDVDTAGPDTPSGSRNRSVSSRVSPRASCRFVATTRAGPSGPSATSVSPPSRRTSNPAPGRSTAKIPR